MKGYLGDPQKTDAAIEVINGHRWYRSGDKGHIDSDGFLTITDRYSRFAKIGGEMVSLSAVEYNARQLITHSFPETKDELEICAVNLPDKKKGEKVSLLVKSPLAITEIQSMIRSSDMNPLMIPAKYHSVDEIPKLGSGKVDFSTAKLLATEKEKE